jgi:hypothetical protein
MLVTCAVKQRLCVSTCVNYSCTKHKQAATQFQLPIVAGPVPVNELETLNLNTALTNVQYSSLQLFVLIRGYGVPPSTVHVKILPAYKQKQKKSSCCRGQ